MIEIVLNDDLEYIKPNPYIPTILVGDKWVKATPEQHLIDSHRRFLNDTFYSTGARKYDYKTKQTTVTETIFRHTVPINADLTYHKNYLHYMQDCYMHHKSIVLTPDIFWYTITCEIANEVVDKSDIYRSIFTSEPSGKIDIIVPCNSETDPLRMDAIYDQMVQHIPVDTNQFLPHFSTTSENSRMATLAAFLEMCSPYYNYMMLACGLPRIAIEGTKDDWDTVYMKVHELIITFGDSAISNWLQSSVVPITEKINEAFASSADTEWFSKIFTQKKCGSGSQYFIDGWFTNMFMQRPKKPEASNFSSHVTKVPYTTLPSGTEWKLCFALTHSAKVDKYHVPDFSWAQVKCHEPKII